MITEGDVAAYDRDGVVCLRGAFDSSWVERMRMAVERDLAAPGPTATNFAEGSSAGKFFGDMFMWKQDDGFRDTDLIFVREVDRKVSSLLAAAQAEFLDLEPVPRNDWPEIALKAVLEHAALRQARFL